MTTTVKAGEVEADFFTWLDRRWKKSGAIITEVSLGHAKGGGAPDVVCILTKEILDSYKETKEICQDLEERMNERCRRYAGRVRFEITLWGGQGGTRVIDSKEIERRGEGRPGDDQLDTTPAGQVTMYAREHHRMLDLTISTLERQINVLEKRLGNQYELIDRLFAKHPELLDLMSKLADNEVEREIRRRQAYRIEGIKDRAIQRLDQALPHLVASMTGGKINLLGSGSKTEGNASIGVLIEPHLAVLVKSLATSGERGMQILGLMTVEERTVFLAIGQIYEDHAATQAQTKKDDNGIKAKEKSDAPAP